MHHLTDDEAAVLAEAELGALRAQRSARYLRLCWVGRHGTIEHDAADVAACVRAKLLEVTPAHSLALTDDGRDALARYRAERRPVEFAA